MSWRAQHEPRFDALVDALPTAPATVLDVGAAPYQLTSRLAAAHPDAEFYGINLGDGDEYTIHRTGKPVEVRECNIETDAWPFATASMEVVVMGAILEHLLDPLAALTEARRVCRDDGVLVLSTPNAARLIQRVRAVCGQNVFDAFDPESRYGRHNREWTAAEVRNLLDAAGWHVESVATVRLSRQGILGRVGQFVTGLRDAWNDQLIVRAMPSGPATGDCTVYRTQLTDRSAEQVDTPGPSPMPAVQLGEHE